MISSDFGSVVCSKAKGTKRFAYLDETILKRRPMWTFHAFGTEDRRSVQVWQSPLRRAVRGSEWGLGWEWLGLAWVPPGAPQPASPSPAAAVQRSAVPPCPPNSSLQQTTLRTISPLPDTVALLSSSFTRRDCSRAGVEWGRRQMTTSRKPRLDHLSWTSGAASQTAARPRAGGCGPTC